MKTWMWLIIAGLIFGLGFLVAYDKQEDKWTIKYQAREQELVKTALVEAGKTIEAENKLRNLNTTRVEAVATVDTEARKRSDDLQIELSTATKLADSLRIERDKAVAKVRAISKTSGSSAPIISNPAEDTIGVFANMLEARERRTIEIERFADEAHSAGLACMASYEVLRSNQ